MKSLASILNRHCPERCKVLLMGMNLLCFNLSVLAENAEKVYLYNFVGVTGHHGMVKLPTISQVRLVKYLYTRYNVTLLYSTTHADITTYTFFTSSQNIWSSSIISLIPLSLFTHILLTIVNDDYKLLRFCFWIYYKIISESANKFRCEKLMALCVS